MNATFAVGCAHAVRLADVQKGGSSAMKAIWRLPLVQLLQCSLHTLLFTVHLCMTITCSNACERLVDLA